MEPDDGDLIRCRDGCGRSFVSPGAAAAGWRFLDIAKGWRCPDCVRKLDRANASLGDDQGGEGADDGR